MRSFVLSVTGCKNVNSLKEGAAEFLQMFPGTTQTEVHCVGSYFGHTLVMTAMLGVCFICE